MASLSFPLSSIACAWLAFYLLKFDLVLGQSLPPGLIPTSMDLNGVWSPLPYNMTASPWVPYLYVVKSPIPFKVVYSDAGCPGQMVSLYINGTFLMNSTQVPFPPVAGICNPRIDLPMATFQFPNVFSHANFSLPAGQHSIAIKVIRSNASVPIGIMYMRAFIKIPTICDS